MDISSEFDDYMRQNDIPPSTNTIHVDQFKVTWRSQVYSNEKQLRVSQLSDIKPNKVELL